MPGWHTTRDRESLKRQYADREGASQLARASFPLHQSKPFRPKDSHRVVYRAEYSASAQVPLSFDRSIRVCAPLFGRAPRSGENEWTLATQSNVRTPESRPGKTMLRALVSAVHVPVPTLRTVR